MFCHGLFGQGRNWTSIGKALSDEHRVVLLDLPHHGRSPWADHFDYVEMADQVAGELTQDQPVALVGHSMGGKLAMVLALRHPGSVARLCVVDVAPVDYEHGSEFAGYIEAMRALDLSSLKSRAEADRELAEQVPSDTVRGFLLQNLHRGNEGWRWRPNLEVLGEELAEVTGWPGDRLAELPPYDGPVLWIAGAESGYVKPDHAEQMDRWFPRNRRITIKDAGHWVHAEQPEVFVEVLRRFLDR